MATKRKGSPGLKRLFATLEALGPVPVPELTAASPRGHAWPRGVKIFARDATTASGVYGRATGSFSGCQLEGCRGIRISTVWSSGKITRPCSRGMEQHADGWRIL